MKLGPETKIDKKSKATSKNWTMTPCWKIMTLLSFFQFMANLELLESRITEIQSVKLTFSLTATFIFQKLQTELNEL